MGFPCSSAGKESACNVGDLGSIPRLQRAPGEGKGFTSGFWPGEFCGLQSMGSQRVGHNLATFTHSQGYSYQNAWDVRKCLLLQMNNGKSDV